MKTTKIKNIFLALLAIVLATTISHAQNYKAPKIDASGRITDKYGKYIGDVTKEGVVSNEDGVEIARVDGNGILIDAKTGKKMGKAEKNGDYEPYFAKPKDGWSVSAPMNGTCLVKDKEGNVKAEVHENYKQFGACAIHCATYKMDHNKVLDESAAAAAYSCPMHPEVTSDKPGKCSKCGMALVKSKT